MKEKKTSSLSIFSFKPNFKRKNTNKIRSQHHQRKMKKIQHETDDLVLTSAYK